MIKNKLVEIGMENGEINVLVGQKNFEINNEEELFNSIRIMVYYYLMINFHLNMNL